MKKLGLYFSVFSLLSGFVFGGTTVPSEITRQHWRAGKKEEASEVWTKAAELSKAKEEGPIGNADEKRVRDTVQKKIDAARSGKEPDVAPLALPAEPADDTDHHKS